ncbi:Arc-like DNA binding domain protein [Labrenzia sp. THAF35]|uniref:Arc family DNA-binding protein n=1 Tax=Labrenzia sp. THAF35 TaxID=2587854 RepID=UPI001268C432|nr:Arc family DNA-binding protein [Labrenzia sp. THAF35]QFT65962.1 Arc-like DNA binding domain protein [Labrenzia sp. THAF35]
MTSQTKAKDKDQFVVRLPNGMRDQIAEAAKLSNRSMNAEIVARLEETFLSSVSARYKWALAQINDAGDAKISVSKVAEAVSEETAEQLERVFGGSAYPPFELSDRVAKYLNVRTDWLKHGEGHPFEVHALGSYGAELAETLAKLSPKKIAFIRSTAREGNVAIVTMHDGFDCKIFKTTLNLSEVVGGSGEYDQASFSNTCRKLSLDHKQIDFAGYLLEPEPFVQLIHGDLNPLLAVKQARASSWFSDWWQPSSFENQANDYGYWAGYQELCKRVYRILDMNDDLRNERDEILGGNVAQVSNGNAI